MPTDMGRAWDALMRRHWKGLWTTGHGREADEARAKDKRSRSQRIADDIRRDIEKRERKDSD